MSRFSYAVLAGALAFGLTAAAATGTAFTISSVQNVPGTDSATQVVATTSCDGTYAITWTIDQYGFVTGYTATRTAPDPDTNGDFCKNVPAAISVSRGGSVLSSDYGTTDALTGNFSGTFDQTFVADAGDVVELEIGPNAGMI